MSLRSVSLNDVTVADKPTHVIIYQGEQAEYVLVPKKMLEELSLRVNDLTKQVNELAVKPRQSPYFSGFTGPSLEGLEGLEVRRDSDHLLVPDVKDTFKTLITKLEPIPVKEDTAPEAEEEEEEEAEEEVEEVEEEDAALELEEFEYKGITYYKDPDNLVYQLDEDGDLDDSPIGVWSPEKNKVLRYSKV